jgi:hypothetical protein
MAKRRFALEPGGPKRLELSWGGFWKNFQVTLDGALVDTVEGGQKRLKEGVELPLPDGSNLHIQIVQTAMIVELRVLRNGAPLPGSTSDPEQRVRNAAYLLYFLAGLNTLLGVVSLVFDIPALNEFSMGIDSILFGGLVAVLGFFTYRRSRVAPILAIILYVIDAIYTVVTIAGAGRTPPVAGIFIRIAIIYTLVQGAKAAGELVRQKETRMSDLSPHP